MDKSYPLSGRVGLYFIPVMIIFMLKPLETGKWIAVAVVLVFFSFCKYDLNYMKNITTFDYFVSCSPKNLLLLEYFPEAGRFLFREWLVQHYNYKQPEHKSSEHYCN